LPATTSSGFSHQRCSMARGSPAATHSCDSGSAEPPAPTLRSVPRQMARSAAASSGLAEA
jgi:hypothetical protein